MSVVVTGAGGFVGAGLVRRLLVAGEEVEAWVRPGGDPWRLAGVGDDVRRREVDLADPDAVTSAVRAAAPNAVAHLAAHGAYSWQADARRMVAVNVAATAALLEAFDGDVLVHAGTSSEYGRVDHPPHEDEPARPESAYATTKAAATQLGRLADDPAGRRVVTLRLYSVYGAWEEPGRLVPQLVDAALEGTLPPLVDPATARDFVALDDACDAFLATIARARTLPQGSVLNVAGGAQTTLAHLVATACDVFAVTQEPRWGTMAARTWDTDVWVGDPARAAELLGWRAQTTLPDGLRELATWMVGEPQARERYRRGRATS